MLACGLGELGGPGIQREVLQLSRVIDVQVDTDVARLPVVHHEGHVLNLRVGVGSCRWGSIEGKRTASLCVSNGTRTSCMSAAMSSISGSNLDPSGSFFRISAFCASRCAWLLRPLEPKCRWSLHQSQDARAAFLAQAVDATIPKRHY